jgi:hypothetical protein
MTLYVSHAEMDMGLQIYALLTLGRISPGRAASHNGASVINHHIRFVLIRGQAQTGDAYGSN